MAVAFRLLHAPLVLTAGVQEESLAGRAGEGGVSGGRLVKMATA